MTRAALWLAVALVTGCTAGVPAVTSTPRPTDGTVRGGVLRIAQGSDITTLDPWTASDDATVTVVRQVFETLVEVDDAGATIGPGLADRWSASADARVWTVHLRSGVRFHDGTSLDAAAVAFNFRRAQAFARFDLGTLIESIATPDASTVVFTLRTSYAPFLATLAAPSFAIVSPACVALGPVWSTAATTCAAGTGPFVLEPGGWRSGERVTLRRNASYWRSDAAGRRLPYLDGLTFEPIRDEAARLAALKTATIDIALDLGPSSVRGVRSDPNIVPLRRTPFDVAYLAFAMTSPFDRAEVRRAVAMAIDRAAIIQTVYAGEASPAAQLVPAGMLGYDDTLTQFAPGDVAAAKRAVADAGLATTTLDLWYSTAASTALPDPRRVAEAIAADLGRIGLTVVAHGVPAPQLASGLASRRYALWLDAAQAERPDPDAFFADLPLGAVQQELLRRARSETDASKRGELYKQVTKSLQQDAVRVPLWSASEPVGVSRKVRGFTPRPVCGDSFATVWVER